MKSLVIVFMATVLLLSIVICYGSPIPDDDKYTNKYDGVNLDDVLTNDRLLKNYFECIMERGKCTPDGLELRNHVSDALATKCSKCTAKQKDGAEKVIRFLVNNKQDWWTDLSGKYDPEGKFKKEYEDDAKKLGISS